jgi:hypothetical protein
MDPVTTGNSNSTNNASLPLVREYYFFFDFVLDSQRKKISTSRMRVSGFHLMRKSLD